jgi:nicotinate-nucleotide adenylyltransferase
VSDHGRDALPDTAAGSIVFFRMPMVPVSATVLRERLAAGERPAELVPPRVLEQIERHGLYRPAPAGDAPDH